MRGWIWVVAGGVLLVGGVGALALSGSGDARGKFWRVKPLREGVQKPPPPRMPLPGRVPQARPGEPGSRPGDGAPPAVPAEPDDGKAPAEGWGDYASPGEAIAAFFGVYGSAEGEHAHQGMEAVHPHGQQVIEIQDVTGAKDAIREYRNWAMKRTVDELDVRIFGDILFDDRSRRRALCKKGSGLVAYALAAMMRRWAWDRQLIPEYKLAQMPGGIASAWSSWPRPPKSDTLAYVTRALFRDSFCPD